MPYCILSLKKYHTFPQIHALQKHNERQIPLPNVDPSMSVHNVTLYSRGMDYTDAWHEIVRDAEIKYKQPVSMRSNSVLLLEIVTGMSADAANRINITKWAEKNLAWMEKKFGKENIISCTLHLDETSPHIHTEIVPIDERGHLCAKSFTAGRNAMKKLLTEYAKGMEEFGLKRGEHNSKARKKELNEFYKSVKKAGKAALPPRMNGESEEDYIRRMEKYCKQLKLAITNLELSLERSNAMIGTRIAQEFSRYSHAVSLYEDLYDKFDGDVEMVNRRITAYRKIENRTPSDTLSGLLDNLLQKFENRQTPLVNWAEKGRKALKKPGEILEDAVTDVPQLHYGESNSLSEEEDNGEEISYETLNDIEDEDGGGILDI